jgi:single-strand DNA-binding protein
MFHNSGINKVILVGLIHTDPRWETVRNERCLCFQLVTREAFNKQNLSQEHDEYHYIKFPESMAVNYSEELKKGAEIYLEGKINTQSSVDSSGIRRYDTSILVSRFQLMKAPVQSVVIET